MLCPCYNVKQNILTVNMLCLLLFLISFMTGLIPLDTIARTELSGVGKWGKVFIVFHMGTMINLKQLAAE